MKIVPHTPENVQAAGDVCFFGGGGDKIRVGSGSFRAARLYKKGRKAGVVAEARGEVGRFKRSIAAIGGYVAQFIRVLVALEYRKSVDGVAAAVFKIGIARSRHVRKRGYADAGGGQRQGVVACAQHAGKGEVCAVTVAQKNCLLHGKLLCKGRICGKTVVVHGGIDVLSRGVVHAYHRGAGKAGKPQSGFAVKVVERRRSASAVKVQDIAVKTIGIKRFRKYAVRGKRKAFESHVFRRRIFLRLCLYLCRKRAAPDTRGEGDEADKSAC